MFDNPNLVYQSVRNHFGRSRILVIGDLMLDVYLWGDAQRISPEAPIPVLKFLRRSIGAGGAANVACNLAKLGLDVSICGFVGADTKGTHLLSELHQIGIDTSAVVTINERPTITKTRVIGGHQQMLRIDYEDISPIAHSYRSDLLRAVSDRLCNRPQAIILSDYAKGVLTKEICRLIITQARNLGILVFVDPKGANYNKYAKATALSPNLAELTAVAKIPIDSWDELVARTKVLRKKLELEFLVITRSEEGVTLIEEETTMDFPATARKVFDVSGAGDTLIATMVAGLVANLSRHDALQLANLAAGIVVGKVGTEPISQEELLATLSRFASFIPLSKILRQSDIIKQIERWRMQGEKIVFTNGCFDLLHIGHVVNLAKAKMEGDRLIVGLNTDQSVKRMKGNDRPIIPQNERAQIIAALESVDAVILFEEDTPLNLIRLLKPDVLVKGSDYTLNQVVGAEDVKSWGGKVKLLPLVESWSSAAIINKVRSSAGLLSQDAQDNSQ